MAVIERLGPMCPYHVEATNTHGWNTHTWGQMLSSRTEFAASEVLTVDFDGWASRPILLNLLPQPNGPVAVLPGETWYFQLWYRDHFASQGTRQFSDAIQMPLR